MAALYDKRESQQQQMASDAEGEYYTLQNIDSLIARAKEEMEQAAKALDFLEAARLRDRMYALKKIKGQLLDERHSTKV